ncbi:GNAT family N-acetyltransferase [Saccharomonospora piscinae]|uniref:GNAT family N-acetyltransferase n=1 Tax=Saccharomonospora piscinae TaxID=687388 RepID=UPI0004B50421|nr:GNAT family protein [Saccharomonospora piscinae]
MAERSGVSGVSGGPALRLREAEDTDAPALLRWRNDPDTRRWSRTTDPVALPEHRAWLSRVLASPDRLLLVAESAGTAGAEPVGMVRFDDAGEGCWEVSIAVAPEHRGRGLAAPLLAEGERQLRRRHRPGTVVAVLAVVHRDNAASVALFEAAGYRPDGVADAAGDFLRFVRAQSIDGSER